MTHRLKKLGRRLGPAKFLLMTLVLINGCGEKKYTVGETCKMSRHGSLEGCADANTVLRCESQQLVAYPCGGPQGCRSKSDWVDCDQSIGAEGNSCLSERASDNEVACSVDGSALRCEGSKFIVGRQCRGPKGCTTTAGEVLCDQTVAVAGDKCSKLKLPSTNNVCSVDRKSILSCEDGIFATRQQCASAKGCQSGHLVGTDLNIPNAVCDYRGSTLGSSCGSGFANLEICSSDGSSILRCNPNNALFELDRACPKEQRCVPYKDADLAADVTNPQVTCR